MIALFVYDEDCSLTISGIGKRFRSRVSLKLFFLSRSDDLGSLRGKRSKIKLIMYVLLDPQRTGGFETPNLRLRRITFHTASESNLFNKGSS